MLAAVTGSADRGEHATAEPRSSLVLRHARVGWVLVFVYVLLGLVLESLHGFKVGFYLDVSNEPRRLVWTLGHTHGTLIGVLNLGFAATLRGLALSDGQLVLASRCFVGAGVLMPLGFLLGGVVIYGGDPGLPIVLAPLGGLLLVVAVGLAALGAFRREA